MTKIDEEATTIHHISDEATHISDTVPKEVKNDVSELELNAEENKKQYTAAKTIGGVAASAAVLGGAASVFINNSEEDISDLPEVGEDNNVVGAQEDIVIAAQEVELPELIVEAIGSGHMNGGEASQTSEDSSEEDILQSETIHAQVSADNSEISDAMASGSTVRPEETVAAQPTVQEDPFGDIPVVSVDNGVLNDNDIEILGVTQDISTGYNVGHLSVDGEEVVVIDVDGDMVFDSIVADLNHDGDITPDEIIDIHDHGLTLDNLTGHSDILMDPLGGDAPDYLSEV